MRPQDAWRATQGQLRVQLHRATYETWVADVEFVSFEKGVFNLSVRNAYVKDWLETRLYRSMRHTLCGIFRQEIDIAFVVNNHSRQMIVDDDLHPLDRMLPATRQESMDQSAETRDENHGFEDRINDDWNPRLSPLYQFANFVVGRSNQLAYGAANVVKDHPAKHYNPLFVYGESGLGKTHLLQAMGHALVSDGLRVLYTTAEQFTNHLVESIRHKQTVKFRETYRELDVLLLDDVQFLSNKPSTQEEIFHTFNSLHGQGKQIVLAADRHPDNIDGLTKQLHSRFVWGLLVDIQKPELETRLAILRDKAEVHGRQLPLSVAQRVAEGVTGNVRDLEGMLTQVLAYADLMGTGLSLELTDRILAQSREPRDQETIKRRLKLTDVLSATAQFYQLRLSDLTGPSRHRDLAKVRQLAIYMAREETGASLPEIGDALGRNHSTILYNYNKVASQLDDNPDLRRKIADLRHYLYSA